ncbi:hypothetical protein BGX34_004586 [Mortierella sp. NVP85]|nr:hypothetical protein BGX34_004586 [Mortierella sp. NVP85]
MTAFHNTLPFSPALPTADPESGLVYVIQNDLYSAGNATMHALDLNAQTTNSLMIPALSNSELFREAAWNTHLKSVLVTSTTPNAVYVFTPSKVSESSHGWRLQNTKGDRIAFGLKSCFLPLGDGSKMVFVGKIEGSDSSIMRILDVATWTWTTRTTIPHPGSNACAISGDQFIVWGGYENSTSFDTAVVYDMKTDRWVTNYIAPTVPSSTSRAPIQNTPTTTSKPGDIPSSEKKPVIIVIVVTGVLLTIILTIIAVYLGITTQSRTDTLTTGPDDTTSDYEEVSPDSLKKQELYKSVLSGRLHLGPFGARTLPEHPHAMVEDPLARRNVQKGAIEVDLIPQHPHAMVEDPPAKRNVQEGVIEVELLLRHPHVMVEEEPITLYHDKMEWEPTRNWGVGLSIKESNVFVEDVGLFISGGIASRMTAQAFMLDLSVPWNTSDPVFKQLADTDGGLFTSCTLLNGEDIFIIIWGNVHIYNIRTGARKTAFHNMLPYFSMLIPVADPVSGVVYAARNDLMSSVNRTMHIMDPTTQTITQLPIPVLNNLQAFGGAVWSPHLQSVLFTTSIPNVMYLFTPSNMSGSSQGWSVRNIPGDRSDFSTATCFVPAYNGSKMIIYASAIDGSRKSIVHILDVATWAWAKRTVAPYFGASACAVSGDQLIVWGGYQNETIRSLTAVYDMKTDKWTSNYVASPKTPTTTSQIPIPTENIHSTTLPGPRKISDNEEKKLVIIIAIVTGVLLVIILTAIFIYLRTSNRSKAAEIQCASSKASSSDSLSTVVNVDIFGKVPTEAMPRDPACTGPKTTRVLLNIHAGQQQRHISMKEGRLHQGYMGTRPDPENPHAIVEEDMSVQCSARDNMDVHEKVSTGALPRDPAYSGPTSTGIFFSSTHTQTLSNSDMFVSEGAQTLAVYPYEPLEAKRNVQEGANEAQPSSQHPHAMTKEKPTTKYIGKVEWAHGNRGDKEEIQDDD